jgi:hypothetical protein
MYDSDLKIGIRQNPEIRVQIYETCLKEWTLSNTRSICDV